MIYRYFSWNWIKHRNSNYFFLCILLFLLTHQVLGQNNRVNLLQAASLSSRTFSDGSVIRYLHGTPNNPVIFQRKDLLFYCQQATQNNKSEILKASGQVIIRDQDSLVVTGDYLEYNQTTGSMVVWGKKVTMEDGKVTLITKRLIYNTVTGAAYYYTGGKIYNGTSILTSRYGYWFKQQKLLAFKTNIEVIDTVTDDYMTSDTLRYDLNQDIIYFYSPTFIKNEDLTAQGDYGRYYKTIGNFYSKKNTLIETKDYILKGEEVFYDKVADTSLAIDKVSIYNKENVTTIFADTTHYYGNNNEVFAYGDVLIEEISENNDTTYITGDTLIAIKDTINNVENIKVFPKVSIFSNNLKGKSDSLVYDLIDSLIIMEKKPILWGDKSQITAKIVIAKLKNKEIDSLFLNEEPFIIFQDTLGFYNQIKGRNMKMNVTNNEIEQLNVFGNGESLYFILEEDTSLLGLNLVTCSEMTAFFDPKNKIKSILFINKPEGKLIPPHLIEEPDKYLKGFNLYFNEKPLRELLIIRKRFPNITPILDKRKPNQLYQN